MPMPSEIKLSLATKCDTVQQSTTEYCGLDEGPTESTTNPFGGTTWSNKGISALIDRYISGFTGNFLSRDLDEFVKSETGVEKLPRPYQIFKSKALSERVKSGKLERTAKGGYRIVDRDLEELDFLGAAPECFTIRLPMGLNELIEVEQKEIILLCGNPDAGKTAFALTIALENKDIYINNGTQGARGIYHFVSEMGAAAFKRKLLFISETMPEEYHRSVKVLVYKAPSIQDQIQPDAINIIDYLEPKFGDYREVAPTINAIFDSLRTGVAVVCVQQHPGRDPRGGLGVFEKPRLVVCLANHSKTRHCKMASLEKAKNNTTGLSSLIGMEADYEVYRKGTQIMQFSKWGWRTEKQRPSYNTDF